MKFLPLLLSLVYINHVISESSFVEHKTEHKTSKDFIKKTRALPKKNAQLLLSRRFFKKPSSLKTKKPLNKEYTVFPPVESTEKKSFHGPESPYFSIEQETDHKTRVKKMLPEFSVSAIRNKRSVSDAESRNNSFTLVDTDDRQENLKTRNAKKEKIARLKRRKTKRIGGRNRTKSAQSRDGDAVEVAKAKAKRLKKQRIVDREKLRFKKRGKRTRKSKTNSTSLIGRSKKKKNREAIFQKPKKAVETRRLIAARDATIDQYPYVVSIQKDSEHWCAGAILNPKLVITTANCVWKSNRVSRLKVRAGSRHADTGGQVTKIQEVMKHPNWSIRKNPDNDVALLLLDRFLKFSDSVHGVDLPNRVMLPPFDDAWITSWGAERRDGIYDKQAMTLQVYHARLMDRKKCNNVTQRFGVIVTENFICMAQTARRAPCTRDTGAPAVSDGVVWGLASWGIRRLCGTERFPAMFSYTASQTNMDFIANATHYLMADERFYPFVDRYPGRRAHDAVGLNLTSIELRYPIEP